jgi:putative heme-binding domain-containing protein
MPTITVLGIFGTKATFPQMKFSLFLLLFMTHVHAIEPWADKNLPVKDGLVLWLDAGAEPSAQRAAGVWHDASGHQRDARQERAEAQPQMATIWPTKLFKLDGVVQHFVIKTDGLQLQQATVVVYARANANPGGYCALVSANQSGANDYRSGFNIDLGSKGSEDSLTALNVEGAGFVGERNLLSEPVKIGAPFAVAALMTADKVVVNGKASRPRSKGSVLLLDEIRLGARWYDNIGSTPTVSGFFNGDLFEVLIYDRALADAELSQVMSYLKSKYAAVVFIAPTKVAKAAGAVALTAVKNPPIIQPLVPGFTTRKLPVELSNINVLRYREDGRLFAGAYDGKIYLLSDTNGDGLEDKAQVFYQSESLKVIMGMALTPPGYSLGEGVFITTRGKVLLILDKDRDGTGDEVITVAQGWEQPKRMGGGVSDALGIAVAQDGCVFFNLGTTDFTNAYLLDAATGKASFQALGERGSVQEVSADFKTRKSMANGLRYLVGLAFNEHGDLFATEQEGATWLANGNPFDELLHIQPQRYYGFPPQHPQHLPGVVDEPSTFDYAPQHQSTVGLAFNTHFGPAWWRGDALVAAMSRGKIYRTKLIKTDAGYVAHNETFAQLQRIIIDQAVTPRGALTVALHSGSPDWGTGPTGTGELWQITPIATPIPQPVVSYSASLTELHVVFDQPLTAAVLAAMQGKVSITQGRYVQAGDRFETMRPGYQVVKNQLTAARYPVAVRSLSLSADQRTLIIKTADRTAAVNYGISITGDIFATHTEGAFAGQIDLMADLTGLEITLADGTSHWLPHPDFAVARGLFPQSAIWSKLSANGPISIKGQLDLGLMLYPAVQEGSKLDWQYPDEKVTLVLDAARPFKLTLGKESVISQPIGKRHEARQQVTTKAGTWLKLSIAFDIASGDPDLKTSWFTDRSPTPRSLALRRVLLPYAQAQETAPMARNEDLPQLAQANWNNGQTLFKGICSICHTMRGEGGKVGPDLTNLIYRDYDSVLRDIHEPSAAINPEHVGYTIKNKDGSELTAVWIAENAISVTFAQLTGQLIDIPRSDIAEQRQLPISLMPAGLDKALNAEQLRDLMSYLLLPPFEPAPLMLPDAPPPRKMADVKVILGDALTTPMDAKAKPLHIVLCASEKDTPHIKPGYHDYPLWRSRWTRLLGMAPGITVEQANDWPSSKQWAKADLIAFNSYNPSWTLEKDITALQQRGDDMDAFLARGGGITFLHYTMNAGGNASLLASRLGLAWGNGARYRHGASDWVLDKNHQLAAGFDKFQIPDESYWHLTGDLAAANAKVLATSLEDNAHTPQMWTREVGPGRVFVSIPGHYTWTHDDPFYRILILRGMMWTAHQPPDRLAPLSIIGARVEN